MRTAEGQSIGVSVVRGSVFLNGSSTVVIPNPAASCGTIHLINQVPIPSGLHRT